MIRFISVAAIAFVLTLSIAGTATADSNRSRSLTLDDRGQHLASAIKGDARAQTALGLKYSEQRNVRSDAVAHDWFRRAADQGDAEAQLLLSGMVATGRGAEKDNVAAYKWAYLSGLRTTEPAVITNASAMIGVLSRQMSEAEIDQARQQANQWKPKPEALQPACVQTASAASVQGEVDVPAPAKVETTAKAKTPAVEAPIASTKVEPVAMAKAEAPVAAAAKPDARRNTKKHTAASSQGKPRQFRTGDVRYDDMIDTAISHARAYGLHVGGWRN